MSVTVKAFLYRRSWREEPTEIRRFSLDQDVSTSYSYLVQKLAQVFPSVAAEEIVLSWEDAEGDHVNISTDEELIEALDQFDGSIFKIHLKKREKPCCPQPVFCPLPCHPLQPPSSHDKQGGEEKMEEQTASSEQKSGEKEGPRHVNVVCDSCNSEIYGVRYKCLVCSDYDLCSSCEKKGEHVNHNMMSIRDPLGYNPWGFPRGGGRCGGPWRGRRGGRHCGAHAHHGGPWGPWVPPYFLQNFFGGQWGGQQQSTPEEKPAEAAKNEEMETEQQNPADQSGGGGGEQAQLEREQRQSYLQDIGEAVSSFLRPFGVKVDVDVVDEEQGKKKTEDSADTSDSAPSAPSKVPSGYEGDTPTLDDAATASTDKSDPIKAALSQLQGMGFDNEGGWLTELIRAKGGDIEKVLDALHPSQID